MQRHRTIVNVLAYLVSFLIFFPILWTAITGLKLEVDAMRIPPKILFHPTIAHYAEALLASNYAHYAVNSLTIVGISLAIALTLGIPAAYSIAFYKLKQAKNFLFFILSTRFMPGVAIIVPIYILWTKFHLIDTKIGLIIMYTALSIPLVVWLMRSFFIDIPFEIVEAGLIDGLSHLQILCYIIIPLSLPGLATTAILCTVFCWNEFFFAVSLTQFSAGTLPVYMSSFMTTKGQVWASLAAVAICGMAPILIAGWIIQKGLLKGLTLGALR